MTESTATPAAALSVVLVTPDGVGTLRGTLAHLRRQTVRERIEIVLVGPSRRDLGEPGEELTGFAAWRFVAVGPLRRVGCVRAAGVRAATAPVVAFGEDHSFPEAGWAEALIAAHEGPWAAVGPTLLNANPESAVSWGALFAGFAPWIGGPARGPVPELPWHNSAYKRELLVACGSRLEELLDVESLLQAELRARGHELFLEPTARTRHFNISRPGPETLAEFTAGRHFALARRREEDWSPFRRAAAALTAPASLPVRALRLLPHVRRARRATRLPRGTWLAIGMSLAAHVAGEAVGAVLGPGRVLERRADFEFRRWRFLSERDARWLRSEET